MRKLVVLCVAGILVAGMAASASGRAIFVDPAAAGGGDGSRDSPLRSAGEALETARPGDSVRLKGGTYSENLVVKTSGIRISSWGSGRPRIVVDSTDDYAVTITADDVEVGGIEIRAPKGIRIGGELCTVRDVVFAGCTQPLTVKGHHNLIANNTVRGSRIKGAGRLLEIVGDYNSALANTLSENDCRASTGIFCQGHGANVRNNIIYCGRGASLRYGIVSSSLTGGPSSEPCTAQEISHNRIYGSIGQSMIRIEGPGHERNSVHHNTLAGAGGAAATGIKCADLTDKIVVTCNLITGMKTGMAFDSASEQQCDYNNLFKNGRDIASTGKVAVAAGKNTTREQRRFQSVDPQNAAFLFLVPPDSRAVNGNDHADEYAGARPVYSLPDRRNMAFGKTIRTQDGPRVEWNDKTATSNAGTYALYAADGHRLGNDKFMWWAKPQGHLGWHTTDVFCVIVDLEKVAPIDAVRVNMGNRIIRSAFLPYSIRVLVSEDDHDYYPVGKIVRPREVPDGNYLLEAGKLATRGRYVLLEIHPNGTWPALDEVEVISGTHDPETVRFQADRAVERPDAAPVGISRSLGAYGSCKDTLDRITGYVEQAQKLKGPHEQLEVLRKQIARLKANLRPSKPDIEEVMSQASKRLSAVLFEGRGGYVLSAFNPYRHFDSTEVPIGNTADIASVTIRACRNEVEPGTFLVTSGSDKDINFTITVDPLNGRRGKPFPANQILLRHGVKAGGDALVKLDHGQGNRLVVPPGETHLVWISADTANVPADTYRGKIALTADGAAVKSVDLVVKVHPLKLSDRTSLKTFPWLYAGGHFRHNSQYEARQFRAYKANTINSHDYTPHPPRNAFDEKGHLIKPINYGPLDSMFEVFDKEYFDFYVFKTLFVYEEQRKLMQEDMEFGSARWETAAREWINDWAMYMDKEYGITTDQFALYLRDEPVIDQIENLMARLGRVLKTADPKKYPYVGKVKIFVNPMQDTLQSSAFDHLKAADPYLGIICPTMHDYSQEILDDLHALKSELWGYVGGFGRGRTPYPARLMAWQAMKQGLKGIGFWVWGYDTKHDMVYGHGERVPGSGGEPAVPSRRLEAWRDGIDDYELLEKLKALAQEGAARGLSEAQVKDARNVFDQALENVLGTRRDPDLALREREKIIAALLRLAK